jgi:glycosyltransferase involved in cell wall biosynthesis
MNSKIKLCLISPFPPPYGGISNWSTLLEKHIYIKGNIELFKINISPNSRVTEGRTLWDRIIKSGISMLKLIYKFKKIIKNNKPDVVHITTSGKLALIRDILFLYIAKKNSIPTVYHIRFGRIKEIFRKNNLEWKFIYFAMKLSSKVISIDKTTYNLIADKVDTIYIPNPIDISEMPNPKKANSHKFVMYLGWVIKNKGIEELLSAWEDINNSWTLKVVGPYHNDYLNYLKKKYKLKNVVFEGEKDHSVAMKLLNESAIFILPSYTEGFPNVILEAMSLAKPIIATRVGAIPEILKDCGFLINPKSEKDIKLSLKELKGNKIKRDLLGEKAYNKVRNNYTLEIIYEKYFDLWMKLKEKKL